MPRKQREPKLRHEAVEIRPAIVEFLISRDFHRALGLCRHDADRRALRSLYFFATSDDRQRIAADTNRPSPLNARDAETSTMPTTILSDVDALRLELHALRARVDALEAARRRLSRSDHRLLARLLPAIVGTFGSDVFTANDVVTNPAPAIRIVIGDRSTKSVGRLLARAADAGAVTTGCSSNETPGR